MKIKMGKAEIRFTFANVWAARYVYNQCGKVQ